MDKTIIFYWDIDGKEERVVKNESELTELEKTYLYDELVSKLHSSPVCVQERFINELLREINKTNEEPEAKGKKRSKRERKVQTDPGEKTEIEETRTITI